MFTNRKSNETPGQSQQPAAQPANSPPVARKAVPTGAKNAKGGGQPSTLSTDLFIKGNLKTESDIKIEGQVEGDVRARLLTIGEHATIRGQLMGDEVVINGRIIGKIRGIKVRLNSGARVEGDIIHETIAIEAGAHFEGSVKRQDNPLAEHVAPPAARIKRGPKDQDGS